MLRLHRAGDMNEAALAAFAGDGKYEETVVALAALSKVPIAVADRLMAGERPDPVLILCKAAGLSWPTVKAVITARPDGKPSSTGRHRCRICQLRPAFGIRPRNASCDSGKCSEARNRASQTPKRRFANRVRPDGSSESMTRDLRAPPWLW